MTRLHRLAAHPRRTLGALAVVLAAVGITVGSGANFTASAANPGNAFTTGTLVIANSPSTAILSATGLKPGDSSTRDRRHHEHRLLAGDFALTTVERGRRHRDAPRPARTLVVARLRRLDQHHRAQLLDRHHHGVVQRQGQRGLTNAALGNYAAASSTATSSP